VASVWWKTLGVIVEGVGHDVDDGEGTSFLCDLWLEGGFL